MRPKKNKTFYNSWRLSGIATRDRRQIKDPDQDVGVGKPKLKNTKRWCRGKVGREHSYRWVLEERYRFTPDTYNKICSKCHKVADTCRAFYKRDCKCGHHGPKRKY